MTKAAHNIELIKRVLRLSDAAYNTLVFEQGATYLDLYMADDTTSRAVLLELPEYWAWWRRGFEQRNARFVQEQYLETWGAHIDKYERGLLLQRFYDIHSAELLDVRPSRNVMRRAMQGIKQRLWP